MPDDTLENTTPSKPEHTPGPWFVNPDGWVHAAPSLLPICAPNEPIHDGGEDGANARLIAAAPDLLEALKILVPLMRSALINTSELVDAVNDLAAANGYDHKPPTDLIGLLEDLGRFDALIAVCEEKPDE